MPRKTALTIGQRWADMMKAILASESPFTRADIVDQTDITLTPITRMLECLVEVGLLEIEIRLTRRRCGKRIFYHKRGNLAALQSQKPKE